MTVYYVRSEIAFTADRDRITDELYDLAEGADTGIVDPSMTGSLADRTVRIVMGVEADSPRDAARLFSANVRAALHAAECATPGWPTYRPTGEPDAELVPA